MLPRCTLWCACVVLMLASAEAAPVAGDSEVVSINGIHDHHNIMPRTKPSSVSFSYQDDQQSTPKKHSAATKPVAAPAEDGPEARLVQMGSLLNGFKDETSTGVAIASLTSALRAKILMEDLKPDGIGSFVHAQSHEQKGLGEESEDKGADDDADKRKFDKLMHAKQKNMAAITAYLMKRKNEGMPLTANEDQQLQKFYYNRASTILKKIVLLRKGQTPPEFESDDKPKHETDAPKKAVAPEDEDSAESADETEKLKYDAQVANDNTAYDDRETQKLEREEEAEDAERMAEDREEMDKLEFDRKIAMANEKYNDRLLAQVRKEAHKAARVSHVAKKAAEALRVGVQQDHHLTKVENELSAQKERAQKAVSRFTSEQQDAEGKVEAAEKAKQEADAEAAKAAAMLAKAEKQYKENKSSKSSKHKRLPIAHLSAAERMHNMVEYLRTALSHHNHLSEKDLKIMQTFFLEHGGQMLSKIAQVEPDATWNDKGVMTTEQWAMDHHRPDQLSQEWGGKNVKGDTLVRDVVRHELDERTSPRALRRPNQQAIQGLFGQVSKLPLKFDPDHSQKIDKEPELGEGMDDEFDQQPNRYAYQSLMGIN